MKSKSYEHQHKKRLDISWKEYGDIVRDLVKRAKDEFNPDCVIGNSKGGCIVGGTLAAILRVDFYPMRISRREKDRVVFKKPRVVVFPPGDVRGKKVLLVDDMSVSGETFKMAKEILTKKKPKEIKTLSLARHKDSFLPDFCGLSSDDCIAFPWDKWIYTKRGFVIHPELIISSRKPRQRR